MSEIRVSDMIEAESVNDNDVIMIVQDGVNKKAKAKKIKKDFIEVAGIDEYDNTSTYAEGDYCIYNNKMYKCTTEILTAEGWTAAHWTETSIVEEIDNGGGGSQVLGDTLPIGIIMEYPGSNIPSGWLLCDGQAVSRTLYSELFNLLGTTYGSGDGSTTFNVPNLKGKVAVGKDDNDTDFDTLGETGGEKTHILSVNEMPSHSHTPTSGNFCTTGNGTANNLVNSGSSYAQTSATANTGGGQPHNNLQPYIVQNFLIKAKQTTPTTSNIVNEYSTSTTDGYSANYVEGLHTYSTSEIRIGTYMDKPLYRKVVEIGSLPNNTTQTYNHNISNMDTLKDYDLIWYDTTDNRFFKAPRIDNLEVFVKCEISTTNIEIIAKGVNWSNRTQNSKVILEYTKTTD